MPYPRRKGSSGDQEPVKRGTPPEVLAQMLCTFVLHTFSPSHRSTAGQLLAAISSQPYHHLEEHNHATCIPVMSVMSSKHPQSKKTPPMKAPANGVISSCFGTVLGVPPAQSRYHVTRGPVSLFRLLIYNTFWRAVALSPEPPQIYSSLICAGPSSRSGAEDDPL